MSELTPAQETLLAASNEAVEKYQGDWDHANEEPVDDWGMSAAERQAFVAGALFEHRRSAQEGDA